MTRPAPSSSMVATIVVAAPARGRAAAAPAALSAIHRVGAHRPRVVHQATHGAVDTLVDHHHPTGANCSLGQRGQTVAQDRSADGRHDHGHDLRDRAHERRGCCVHLTGGATRRRERAAGSRDATSALVAASRRSRMNLTCQERTLSELGVEDDHVAM